MAVRHDIRPKVYTNRKPAVAPRWPTAFDDDRQKGQRRLRLAFLMLLLAGWIYLFFFSGTFGIKQVLVTGNNAEISGLLQANLEHKIASRKLYIFRRDNVYLFSWPEKVALAAEYGLAEINWSKNLLDLVVHVDYKEKLTKLITVIANTPYYLDVDGLRISKVNMAELPENLPTLLFQETNGDPWQIVTPQLIRNIYSVEASALASGIKIVAYKIQRTPNLQTEKPTSELDNLVELAVMTENNIEIHFGESFFTDEKNLAKQLYNLEVLFKTKLVKSKGAGLKYIDLRFGDRVFYK